MRWLAQSGAHCGAIYGRDDRFGIGVMGHMPDPGQEGKDGTRNEFAERDRMDIWRNQPVFGAVNNFNRQSQTWIVFGHFHKTIP